MNKDRNLLLAILAAQLKGVDAVHIVEAGTAWAEDPSRAIASRLVEMGVLTPQDREILERLVDELLQLHGGDATRAMTTLGGDATVATVFRGTLRLTPDGGVETRPLPSVRGGRDSADVYLSLPEEAPGRYSRVSEYGKGGMGRVLLAHDEYMDRDVAMKELLPARDPAKPEVTPVAQATSLVARFLREGRLTGLLEHPSIVPVYELGRRANGSVYYTMKLVRGKTLLQALRACKSMEDRLQLLPHFLDLCHAIAYAHGRGVIHRDIKPSNIMVGEFGETVVLDWGIAKAHGDQDIHEAEIGETLTALRRAGSGDEVQTEQGQALGTPHYMPPEQAQGRIADIDKRSDVYSLGAVLYELLSAKTPHSGKTTREILENVVSKRVASVLEQAPDTPPELAMICEKALEKDPADRYQSAREMAEDVRRFLSGALVKAYKYNLGELLRHYYRRHRAVVHTAAAGAIAFLCLAVYAYVRITQAYLSEQEQRRLAEQARDTAVAAEAAATLARDAEAEARQEAEYQAYLAQIHLLDAHIRGRNFDDARKLVWEVPESHRGWEWGYLLNLCHQDLRTIEAHDGSAGNLQFTPDGARFLSVGGDKTANLWDAESGGLLHTFTLEQSVSEYGRFSPDGHRVVFGCYDGVVRVFNTDSGALESRFTGHTRPINYAEFSPDGNTVASASNDGTVRLWDAATGESKREIRFGGEVWRVNFAPGGGHLLVQTKDDMARVFGLDSGEARYSVPGQRAAFSPDGRYLVAIQEDGVAQFNAETGAPIRTLAGKDGAPLHATFSPDGKLLLGVGAGNSIEVWNPETGDQVAAFEDTEPIKRAAMSGDGSVVAGIGPRGRITLWRLTDTGLVTEFAGHQGEIDTALFRPGSTELFTSGRDHTVKVWDTTRSSVKSRHTPHQAQVRAIAVARDGTRVATASQDKTVRVTKANIESPEAVYAMFSYGGPSSIAFNRGATRLAGVFDEFGVLVIDLASHRVVSHFTEHLGSVDCLDYSPVAERIVSGSWDNTARIWAADTGTELQVLEGHGDSVTDVAFSPDGARVLTGSLDDTIGIWDAQTGARLLRIEAGGTVDRVAWNMEGTLAAAAVREGKVNVWDATNGNLTWAYAGAADVNELAVAPDATRYAGVGWDGAVKLWDAANGKDLLRLDAGSESLFAAVFLGPGQTLLAGDGGGAIWSWQAAPWSSTGLTDNTPEAWRARFDRFKEDRLAALEPSTTEPVPFTVYTTGRILSERLERLGDAARSSVPVPVDATGFLIAEGTFANAGARICLRPGDRFSALAGIPIHTPEDLAQALGHAITNVASGTPVTGELERDGTPYALEFVCLESVTEEKTVSLTREQALGLIAYAREYLDRATKGFRDYNRWRAQEIGEPMEGQDALSGLWILPRRSEEEKTALMMGGIATAARVTAVDGKPLDGSGNVGVMLDGIADRIQESNGQLTHITIEFGELERREYTIHVKK